MIFIQNGQKIGNRGLASLKWTKSYHLKLIIYWLYCVRSQIWAPGYVVLIHWITITHYLFPLRYLHYEFTYVKPKSNSLRGRFSLSFESTLISHSSEIFWHSWFVSLNTWLKYSLFYNAYYDSTCITLYLQLDCRFLQSWLWLTLLNTHNTEHRVTWIHGLFELEQRLI